MHVSSGIPSVLIDEVDLQIHLNCVQYYASSENVSLLPLVVRLSSVKAMS